MLGPFLLLLNDRLLRILSLRFVRPFVFFVFTVVRSATRLSSGLCNAAVVDFRFYSLFRRFSSTLPLSRKRREPPYLSPSLLMLDAVRSHSSPAVVRPLYYSNVYQLTCSSLVGLPGPEETVRLSSGAVAFFGHRPTAPDLDSAVKPWHK